MSLEDKPLSLRGGVWGGVEERGLGRAGRKGIGDWGLEIGEWRVGSGDWGLGIGDWRLESGDWRVESGDGRSLMSYLDIAEKNSSIPPHPRPPLLEDEGVFTPINIVVKRKVIR